MLCWMLVFLGTAFVAKGDDGHWQPDYSDMLGGLAADEISTLYYPSTSRPGHTVIHSLNWAGYAGNRPGTRFRHVSAAFQVPYLDCAAVTKSYSSHWVGLDGLGSATVEQVGIEADCAGSTPRRCGSWRAAPFLAP